ncbi:hypothetical protein [Oscillibacter sp.]|uniref:hypothetical protein n=1 Tax=Oscillibacter sp. TaxID=1945593 RepID=UPI0026161298|nr:hypothetical protein [Oscillibacter sp.]MDD3346177.1 hypothetical protein [Oscillibacter sp.]
MTVRFHPPENQEPSLERLLSLLVQSAPPELLAALSAPASAAVDAPTGRTGKVP